METLPTFRNTSKYSSEFMCVNSLLVCWAGASLLAGPLGSRGRQASVCKKHVRAVRVKEAVLVLSWSRRHGPRPLRRVSRLVARDLAGKGAAIGQAASHRCELIQGKVGHQLPSSASTTTAADDADASRIRDIDGMYACSCRESHAWTRANPNHSLRGPTGRDISRGHWRAGAAGPFGTRDLVNDLRCLTVCRAAAPR